MTTHATSMNGPSPIIHLVPPAPPLDGSTIDERGFHGDDDASRAARGRRDTRKALEQLASVDPSIKATFSPRSAIVDTRLVPGGVGSSVLALEDTTITASSQRLWNATRLTMGAQAEIAGIDSLAGAHAALGDAWQGMVHMAARQQAPAASAIERIGAKLRGAFDAIDAVAPSLLRMAR